MLAEMDGQGVGGAACEGEESCSRWLSGQEVGNCSQVSSARGAIGLACKMGGAERWLWLKGVGGAWARAARLATGEVAGGGRRRGWKRGGCRVYECT